MAIASLIVSIIAVISAIAMTVYVKKQADAAEAMKDLATKEQKANFERWLAANKPWLRISFPSQWKEPNTQSNIHVKGIVGGPVLISITNYGKLPCKILKCTIGTNEISGDVLESSITENRVGGSLIGARLVPGESQIFLSQDLKDLVKISEGGKVRFALEYRYGPDEIEKYGFDLQCILKDQGWVDVVPLESTAD